NGEGPLLDNRNHNRFAPVVDAGDGPRQPWAFYVRTYEIVGRHGSPSGCERVSDIRRECSNGVSLSSWTMPGRDGTAGLDPLQIVPGRVVVSDPALAQRSAGNRYKFRAKRWTGHIVLALSGALRAQAFFGAAA